MNELATQHPRWGYRVVWTLLKAEGWAINKIKEGPLTLGGGTKLVARLL
jgi:hypothetical protein